MDKGKTCKTCCKLKESTNDLGRCETCQTKIETNIERLRRKNEGRKQARLDNPDKFREREKSTEKQTRRR